MVNTLHQKELRDTYHCTNPFIHGTRIHKFHGQLCEFPTACRNFQKQSCKIKLLTFTILLTRDITISLIQRWILYTHMLYTLHTHAIYSTHTCHILYTHMPYTLHTHAIYSMVTSQLLTFYGSSSTSCCCSGKDCE